MNGNSAAAALQSGGQDGMGGAGDDGEDQNQAGGDQDSFFLPPDFLGGKKYKKGDKITLEVMGTDDEGDIEVCLPGKGGEDDWRTDLRNTMQNSGTSGAQGYS